MLLLFTIFTYLPNFIFSRSTANLMISQKIMQYEQFQLYLLLALTSFGTLVMKENYFFHSDLKFVLVVVVPAILERFTFFLTGLIDLDDSAILILFEFFSKDLYMSKNRP